MLQADIKSYIVKKYCSTPTQNPIEERENMLNQDFTTKTINEKWVADITHIPTLRNGWCYLASVLDLHTKKVVGYKFSRTMMTEFVLEVLQNAIDDQNFEPSLIVNKDLGIKYTSEAFQELLKQHKIIPSFRRNGCPYDNACIKSFHATLKKEEVYLIKYESFETAKIVIFQFIVGWNNRKQIH